MTEKKMLLLYCAPILITGAFFLGREIGYDEGREIQKQAPPPQSVETVFLPNGWVGVLTDVPDYRCPGMWEGIAINSITHETIRPIVCATSMSNAYDLLTNGSVRFPATKSETER